MPPTEAARSAATDTDWLLPLAAETVSDQRFLRLSVMFAMAIWSTSCSSRSLERIDA